MRAVVTGNKYPQFLLCRRWRTTKEELVEKILRVDHAGEYGARRIYEGQLYMLGSKDGSKEIKEMYEQEKIHYDTLERLIIERRARPSALIPFWDVAGFVLGKIRFCVKKFCFSVLKRSSNCSTWERGCYGMYRGC